MSEVSDQVSVKQTEETVEIVRAVRFGRLMMVGAVIGAVVAVIATLSMQVAEGALYTMNQIAGFMLVLGAALGMVFGALLGLLLNLSARKKRGMGKAVHTDARFEDAGFADGYLEKEIVPAVETAAVSGSEVVDVDPNTATNLVATESSTKDVQ